MRRLLGWLALACSLTACGTPTTRLLKAAEAGDTARIRTLLDADATLTDSVDAQGRSALRVALASAQGAAASMLLERGAALDPTTPIEQLRTVLVDASTAARARAGLDRRDGVWIGETSDSKIFGFEIWRERIDEGFGGFEVGFSDVPSYAYGSVVEMTLNWCEAGGCAAPSPADGSFSATTSGDAIGLDPNDPYHITTDVEGRLVSDSLAEGRFHVQIDSETVDETWTAHRVAVPDPFPIVEVEADPEFIEIVNGWQGVFVFTSAEEPIKSLSDLESPSDVCMDEDLFMSAQPFMEKAGSTEGVTVCNKPEAHQGVAKLLIADETWAPWVATSGAMVRFVPSPGKKPNFSAP